jgi:hypothetical protein
LSCTKTALDWHEDINPIRRNQNKGKKRLKKLFWIEEAAQGWQATDGKQKQKCGSADISRFLPMRRIAPEIS